MLPGATDDVTISGSGPITHASGTDSIHSLQSSRPLTLSGGSLYVESTAKVDNTFTIDGGTLAHATVNPGIDGQGLVHGLTFTSAGGTLDGVTANADLNLASGYANVTNGLVLNATARLGDNAWNYGSALVPRDADAQRLGHGDPRHQRLELLGNLVGIDVDDWVGDHGPRSGRLCWPLWRLDQRGDDRSGHGGGNDLRRQ